MRMGQYRLTEHGMYGVLVIDRYHYDSHEDISVLGFPTLALAVEYARRRTRDSLEEMRGSARTKEELRKQWSLFGEDCIVLQGDYKGSSEIDDFLDHPAMEEERDWKGIEKLARGWTA